MSTILAIDLGKFKSVACTYRTTGAEHIFQAIPTRPQAMHDLDAKKGMSTYMKVPPGFDARSTSSGSLAGG